VFQLHICTSWETCFKNVFLSENGLQVPKHVAGLSRNNKWLRLHMQLVGFNTVRFSFIRLAVCLTTGPKPLPKPALHTVRSSFKWDYRLLVLMSSSSFVRLLLRLPTFLIFLRNSPHIIESSEPLRWLKSQPLLPILSQITPVHDLPARLKMPRKNKDMLKLLNHQSCSVYRELCL